MGRRPKWGRPVHGVLLLNKSSGVTSNTALQQARQLFFARRAGHTGSLDPLATGVLPICFGEATKFSQYLLDADKRYLGTFRFGIATETGDGDGDVVAVADASRITEALVEKHLSRFRGKIRQRPPRYSALKYQGKPLYQWAREGRALPAAARQPRDIEIYRYEIRSYRNGDDTKSGCPEVDVEVHCSKGTYIRSLAEDLGEALGCGAHVLRLQRLAAGPFEITDTVSLQQLQQERGDRQPEILNHHLLPTDAPVAALPPVTVTDDMGVCLRQGQPVMSLEAYHLVEEGDMVRLLSDSGQFLGLGELVEGSIAPRRIVNF